MYQEIKLGSLIEIYNKFLPFNPRKLEGSSVGTVIDITNSIRYEVDVPGINGHAGSNHKFITSRWYVPSGAIKGCVKPSNYIEEVE